jgi:hypothetical protein
MVQKALAKLRDMNGEKCSMPRYRAVSHSESGTTVDDPETLSFAGDKSGLRQRVQMVGET